jgi:chemotaxis protein methyltransferase CheR
MSPWATATTVSVASDEYLTFCAGVQALCGVDLAGYERGQMERRIRSFAVRRGAADLSQYLLMLTADQGELERLVDRATINVSQLWRDAAHWEVIAERVIPLLASGGLIRAWSAGCSDGAEAYTFAALCREVAPTAAFEIRASDIDRRMIERAREGCFSDSDARSAPLKLLERWFERVPEGWRAAPELRAGIRFQVENLLTALATRESYDFIACRNTVIYLNAASRATLHAKLARALRRGGFLMVGATERIVELEAHRLALVHPCTYRKS